MLSNVLFDAGQLFFYVSQRIFMLSNELSICSMLSDGFYTSSLCFFNALRLVFNVCTPISYGFSKTMSLALRPPLSEPCVLAAEVAAEAEADE